jgi:hypothetical protein
MDRSYSSGRGHSQIVLFLCNDIIEVGAIFKAVMVDRSCPMLSRLMIACD